MSDDELKNVDFYGNILLEIREDFYEVTGLNIYEYMIRNNLRELFPVHSNIYYIIGYAVDVVAPEWFRTKYNHINYIII